MFTHDILPPLKAWPRGRSLFCSLGYLWPEWVAIMLTDEGVRRWDRVFDTHFSMETEGQPGIVPNDLHLHYGRYHLIPAEYLSQMDPAWVKRVRRCPEFHELKRLTVNRPVDLGNGVVLARYAVFRFVDIGTAVEPRTRIDLYSGLRVEVPGTPAEVSEAMLDPRHNALYRHRYDPDDERDERYLDRLRRGVLARFEEARS